MDRRVTGALVLLVALLAGLVVPRVLHPSRVAGVASAEPPAAPLAVGDCLRDGVPRARVNDRGAPVPTDTVVTVGCHDAHRAEVVLVDDAADGTSDDVVRRCIDELVDRWSLTGDGFAPWDPQLDIDLGLAGPDARQQAVGQRWTACVVGPTQSVLDRPLAAAPPGSGPPPEFASCSRTQAGSDSAVTVPCTEHHSVETFGRRDLDAGAADTQDELAAGCVDLVAAATGRQDLSGIPDLTVETPVYAAFTGDSQPVIAPIPSDALGGWATCLVRTADGRELTASLRRLGDAPLPWAS